MQLLKPSSPWYAVMLLLTEASEIACRMCNISCACVLHDTAVMDSIVVHLHYDIVTVSRNLCRRHSSNIVCCEVDMHSAATYESQV